MIINLFHHKKIVMNKFNESIKKANEAIARRDSHQSKIDEIIAYIKANHEIIKF